MAKNNQKTKYVQRMATVTLANGEKKRISARGRTEKEAVLKLARLVAKYENGEITINQNTTLERWSNEWLETYKKPTITKKTFENLQSRVQRYFLEYIGKMTISEIKQTHIQKCLNNMEGMSQDTIKKAYNAINEMMNKAYENDIILKNPTIGVTLPKGKPAQSRRALTPEERSLFMSAVETHPKGAMYAMSLATGARPQEVRALTWENVNLKERVIEIKQAVESGTQNIKEPKSKAGYRSIPLPSWYMPFLLAMPKPLNKQTLVFFPSVDGKPITQQRYDRGWASLLRQMDILAGAEIYRNEVISSQIDTTITPYFLRHTYATNLAEVGVEMKAAQYLLGHSSIVTTAKIYTHVTQKLLDNAIEKINKII